MATEEEVPPIAPAELNEKPVPELTITKIRIGWNAEEKISIFMGFLLFAMAAFTWTVFIWYEINYVQNIQGAFNFTEISPLPETSTFIMLTSIMEN